MSDLFQDTTDRDKIMLAEVRGIDRKNEIAIRSIIGIAKQIQRKSQGIGAIARRTYMRESDSYKYISREVDCVYNAMARLIKEIGK